jgi:AraC-like DNA-binding protein
MASARLVRALADVVERAGAPSARFLRAVRLDDEQLDAPEARVPISELYRLFEHAMDVTRDPALGLHWGETYRPNTFAPISHLFVHSASLRQGLQAVARFQAVFTDAQTIQLLERDDTATLRVRSSAGELLRAQRFTAEMGTSSLLRVIRLFCPHACPTRVSFAYPAPDHHAEYARIFGNAVRFDQPFTEIDFDRSLLDASDPQRDPDVHEAMCALAERRIRRLTLGTSYARRLRDILVRQGSPRRAAMKDVARALGLSVRSLRRRLALEGKSYESVREDALALIAKRLLRDRQLTIQETAYEMGFSGASTFHRAFKRWTGTSPSVYLTAAAAQSRTGSGGPA